MARLAQTGSLIDISDSLCGSRGVRLLVGEGGAQASVFRIVALIGYR